MNLLFRFCEVFPQKIVGWVAYIVCMTLSNMYLFLSTTKKDIYISRTLANNLSENRGSMSINYITDIIKK
jgi:hypothetical protein